MIPQSCPKPRIGYIDALRGFTMLLVVCWHIVYFSKVRIFGVLEFFALFRMPLFFFISGFILYKKDYVWNISNSIKFLSKKFLVQIIPTVIFLSLYMFIFSLNTFTDRLNGYWFTITLFEYFLIYSLSNLLIKKGIIRVIFLLICAIFLYFITENTWCQNNYPLTYKYLLYNLQFFIFFIIGTIAKKHFEKICKYVFGNNLIMMLVIAIMFIGSILYINKFFVDLEVKLVLSILGIFSVFYFFMRNGEYMDNSRIGKVLQFIGRRTLDIYLLHYFFINDSIAWVKNIGIESPTIVLTIAIATSFIIVGFCLLLSKFLRTNPLLGKILFGAKMPIKEKG